MTVPLSPILAFLAAAAGWAADSPRIDADRPSGAELHPGSAEVPRESRPSEADARLARSARDPGAPRPAIRKFHDESRPLIQRVRADPAFAGWVFKNASEPYALVLFTGDAAARLAHYTKDPRYRPKSVGLTEAQLRALQDSFGKRLRQLDVHSTYSAGDEENNRVTFFISEMDKYRRAVAEGRLEPNPHVLVVQDKGPTARAPQSAGPVRHFPQFKFPSPAGEALFTGRLEVRNGCLTIGDKLILWPSNARLSLGADGVPLVGGGTGRPLRVGDAVRLAGGTAWTNFRGEGLLEALPEACTSGALAPDDLRIVGEF